MLRALALCLLVASGWTSTPLAATEKPARPVVQYRDGHVTALLKDAPLNAVLQELARASHAELRGPVDDTRAITAELRDVSVQEALERLLGEHNFTLRYEEGRLKTIEVKGVREAPVKPKKGDQTAGADMATDEPQQWIAVYKVFDGRGRVPVSGNLALVVDGDTVSWDKLVNTAIAAEDAKVRRDAVRAAMRMLKDNREFRDSVVGTVGAMSDEDLAMLARKRCFYRAEDLVKNIGREAVDSEMRTRAAGVLRELRKIPYQGPIVPMH